MAVIDAVRSRRRDESPLWVDDEKNAAGLFFFS